MEMISEGPLTKSVMGTDPYLALRMRLDRKFCHNTLNILLASKCEGTLSDQQSYSHHPAT